ncbi:glycosyltransferase [Merdimonas faecis]|uniref:glycosyltransferase n=1 Tax=Merdimonas faecis TaxID=1653435 RepID=UPI0023F822FA|nr:glycosyltransferase [Merdimonas faecis]
MKKILFVIHDLHHGGAEKVLVNLVNNMDREKFDITVMVLFGGGVNEQFLKKDVKLIICHKRAIRGNSKIMKLFSPQLLFSYYIKDKYDIIASYLEGPSARIVSGCNDKNTKLVSWIHVEQHDRNTACNAFRDYKEALECYRKFDCTVCVSEYVKKDFQSIFPVDNPVYVLYNTNETDQIREMAKEPVDDVVFKDDEIKLIGVGKLMANKGFDKLARIHARLIREGYKVHTYILGEGPERNKIEKIADENGCADTVTLLGYRTNPYKYVAKCNIFVCSSVAEGFSTAATEALILGVPVVTTRVSGMEEMLGKNNEFGIVVDGTDEDKLYNGLKVMVSSLKIREKYQDKARERSKIFSKENTVSGVEKMFESMMKNEA